MRGALWVGGLFVLVVCACGGETSGGGSGGSAGAPPAMCPEEPRKALCGGGLPNNDGIVCKYDTMPCPTILECSSSVTHGGWLVRPPDQGSACSAVGQSCTYEDKNYDAGFSTVWAATCTSMSTWDVQESMEPI